MKFVRRRPDPGQHPAVPCARRALVYLLHFVMPQRLHGQYEPWVAGIVDDIIGAARDEHHASPAPGPAAG